MKKEKFVSEVEALETNIAKNIALIRRYAYCFGGCIAGAVVWAAIFS